VEYLKSKKVPLLLVGGGGYTLRNIPRCWTYETSIACEYGLDNKIPENEYSDYFYPEGTIHTPTSNMDNLNDSAYLNDITMKVLENLKKIEMYVPELNVEHKFGKDEK
jgi:histone deacetylase 1/2